MSLGVFLVALMVARNFEDLYFSSSIVICLLCLAWLETVVKQL